MPRFTKTTANGKTLTRETSLPREASRLRAEGFKEQKARTAEVKKADAETKTTK